MAFYLVSVQPCNDFVALVHNSLLVLWADLVLEFLILYGALHVKGKRFKGILGCHFLPLDFILSPELLCFLHHALNVFFAQPACDRIKFFPPAFMYRI